MSLPSEPVEMSVREILNWNQCPRRAWKQRNRSSGGSSSKSSADWVWGQILPYLVKHYLDTLLTVKTDGDLGPSFWKDLTQIARLKVDQYMPIRFGRPSRLTTVKEMVTALVGSTHSAGLAVTQAAHATWGAIGDFDKQENYEFTWLDTTVGGDGCSVKGSVDLVLNSHTPDFHIVFLVQFSQSQYTVFEAAAMAGEILRQDPGARTYLWKVDLSPPQRWAKAAKVYKTLGNDAAGYFRGQVAAALNVLESYQDAENVLEVNCNPHSWCYHCPLFKTGDCPDSEVMDPKEIEL